MDDGIYCCFLITLVALQNQFSSFIEDRPWLLEDMNVNGYRTGLISYQRTVDFEDLNKLKGLEKQSLELEENLLRTMMEVSRSRSSMSHWRGALRRLQRRLETLRAGLRAAIQTLTDRSTELLGEKTLVSSRFMLERKKDQERARYPMRTRSLPDIPSILSDFDFNNLKKFKSVNRSLGFNELPLKDTIKNLDEKIDLIRIKVDSLWKAIMNKPKKTSAMLSRHLPQHQPQQHIEDDPEDDILTLQHHPHSNYPDVSPPQHIEDDSEDDIYPDVLPPQDTEDDNPSQQHRSHSNDDEDGSPPQGLIRETFQRWRDWIASFFWGSTFNK